MNNIPPNIPWKETLDKIDNLEKEYGLDEKSLKRKRKSRKELWFKICSVLMGLIIILFLMSIDTIFTFESDSSTAFGVGLLGAFVLMPLGTMLIVIPLFINSD